MRLNHETSMSILAEGSVVKVREPVQVYLDRDDQERLRRIRNLAKVSKSEALREGLRALERELTNPDAHPALRVVGLARADAGAADGDPARHHDAALADDEVASWGGAP